MINVVGYVIDDIMLRCKERQRWLYNLVTRDNAVMSSNPGLVTCGGRGDGQAGRA